MKKIIIISGYFNPLHSGHIDYINSAKQLGNILIVIINNDKQVKIKGSKKFMSENERKYIVSNLKNVDDAIISIDEDKTVNKSLKKIFQLALLEYSNCTEFIFANGGDRKKENIPELKVCNELNIKPVFNVGGEKVQSSSELLKNANFTK